MADISILFGGHLAYLLCVFSVFLSDIMSDVLRENKTSDMVFKTSDMSGCPTTFHMYTLYMDDTVRIKTNRTKTIVPI